MPTSGLDPDRTRTGLTAFAAHGDRPSWPTPPELVLAGPLELVLAGPLELVLAGRLELVLAGPPESVLAGRLHSVPVGPLHSVLAGPLELVLAGPPESVLAGRLHSVPVGPLHSVLVAAPSSARPGPALPSPCRDRRGNSAPRGLSAQHGKKACAEAGWLRGLLQRLTLGLVLVAVSRVPAEKAAVVRRLLAEGLNPNRAAAAAGVSKSFAYELDRAGGGSRLASRRAAAAARSEARAAAAAGWRARERAVLGLLAGGLNPSRAAAAAGVSRSFAYGLRAKMGGVCRPPGSSCSARYLSREERYEIARLLELDPLMPDAQVAARIGRHRSTVGREIKRNKDPLTGAYLPERADRLAWERQRRPKPSKLSRNEPLRAAVAGMLKRRYSPEQVSGRLKAMHPGDPSMQVSHETIYQSLYVYPRGALTG